MTKQEAKKSNMGWTDDKANYKPSETIEQERSRLEAIKAGGGLKKGLTPQSRVEKS